MKLGFAVNELATERVNYTTTHLALAAHRRQHAVWYIDVGGFEYDPSGQIRAHAVGAPEGDYDSASDFLDALRSRKAIRETIVVDQLDALMLRNDPADDMVRRPWARLAAINFGRLARDAGVVVVNDPDGLYHAVNKLYLQLFPESIRPRTLITRDRARLHRFVEEEGGKAILKPLAGSGGRNVFLARMEDAYNFNQIVDAVTETGYAIAQQFLPGSDEGDTRLFLLEGQVLRVDGKVAAVRRVPSSGDLRSNLSAGGRRRPAQISDAMHAIVAAVGPKLVADGMFLVGLDVMADRVMEINVFSPGGLYGAGQVAEANFMPTVIEAIERRVRIGAGE